MKPSITMIRHNITIDDIGKDCLLPVFKTSIDKLQKLKYNKDVLIRTQQDNNVYFHRLIFAMAKLLKSNLPENHPARFNSEYILVKELQREIGDVEESIGLDGEIRKTPRSIAFVNMPDEEKQGIFNALCHVVAGILQVDENDIKQNYERFLQ